MTTYWKSTGKYYCELCKCWLGNDKPTKDFHEKGKRHNENKKRKIMEIKRDAMSKREQDAKDGKMFASMEKAALAAVQKDAADGMVGRSDIKQMVKAHSNEPEKDVDTYPWSEMDTPQGFKYYYNSLTGESTWQMPEVFKKLDEKKKSQKISSSVTKDSVKEEQEKNLTAVDAAGSSSSTVSERHVHPLLGGWSTVENPIASYKPELPESTADPACSSDPASTSDPSSALDPWRSDSIKDEDNKDNKEEVTEAPRPIGKKFKEKVLATNLTTDSDNPVAFKKRKSGNRNVRKRNEDE